MSRVALVLAAHGSHISAATAGVVWGYVDRLRRLGLADEVTAGFWKEQPAFSRVLDSVSAEEIVIVPVFTAQGYFTTEVLPAEMGLEGALTRRGAVRIHLTPTVGEHRLLDDIVDARLRAAIAQFNLQPEQTAAAVIGHGTTRNRNSRAAAKAQADRLRALGWLNEVVAVYLDDDPAIPTVYHQTRSRNIIALPYFLAPGSHVTQDVPRALGLTAWQRPESVNGRRVYYCEPVGADASIGAVILELARATGLPSKNREPAGDWAGFPTVGRRALVSALKREGSLRFGQVMLSADRVWRSGDVTATRAFKTPVELRTHLRAAPFRPLSTSDDLPGGWRVDLAAPEQAHAVLETVYPGLVADWAAQRHGNLEVEPLRAVSRRQVGLFRDIHQLSQELVQQTIKKVCGGCVCQPIWWRGLKAANSKGSELPCRSACNLWLSSAQKLGEAVA